MGPLPATGIRVLAVDDEPALRKLYAGALGGVNGQGVPQLQRLGYAFEVVTAAQAADAVTAVEGAVVAQSPFAMAFLDMRMPPGHDGLWAAERIRALDPQVNIVFVTGFTDVDPMEMAERVPPLDKLLYLQKPLHLLEVRQFATSLAAKWQTEQLLQATYRKMEEQAHGHIAALQREVDERKAAEAQLLRIRQALDECGAAVAVLDPAHRLHYANGAFLARFVHDAHAQLPPPQLFRHYAEGVHMVATLESRGVWEGEAQLVDVDGQPFAALLRGGVVRAEDGTPDSYLFIISDVTELRQMQDQLRQERSLRALGQLAAGIAHEINTPMQYVGDNIRFLLDAFAGIATFIQQLPPEVNAATRDAAEELDLPFLLDETPAAIEQSLEGVERVTTIVRAMRQFAHPGGDEFKLVDVAETVRSAATVTRNEWKYVAQCTEEFAEGLPAVPCLPNELNQVLLNLIVNASHAMADIQSEDGAADGTLTLRTRRVGDTVEIEVADTGPGIPPDVQPHIFDPFFTTKDVGRGTGQGLAIAHNIIVEKHGGALTFVTEEGVGTTFTIRLPLNREASSE